jgi:hypothetical protein
MARETLIQMRRSIASLWTSTNPTLADGEVGYESDTNAIKIGTGALWNNTAYLSNGIGATQVLTSATTSTTGATLYPVFPSATARLSLLPNTTYLFEGFSSITKQASTATGSWTIGLTFSNTQQNLYWDSFFTSNNGTAATLTGSTYTSTLQMIVGSAGITSAQGLIRYKGIFQSNATTGGTLTPTFAQSAAPTSTQPTANAGSWIRVTPIGNSYPVVAGAWGA